LVNSDLKVCFFTFIRGKQNDQMTVNTFFLLVDLNYNNVYPEDQQ